MEKEPNWGRRGVVAAWILGAPTLAIAILSYVRPPDPTHPMKLDFLINSISLPSWLAAVVVMLAAVLPVTFFRWRLRQQRINPADSPEESRLRSRISELEGEKTASAQQFERIAKEADEEKRGTASVLFNSKTAPNSMAGEATEEFSDLEISAEDNIVVKLSYHEAGSSKGLLLSLINNRLTAIGKYTMRVTNAQSFDKLHNAFRQGYGFDAYSETTARDLGPSCTGQSMWLVRKDRSSDDLLVGNSSANPLKWPDNDKETACKWLLSIEITAQASTNPSPNVKSFSSTLGVIITWNRETNHFLAKRQMRYRLI